MSELSIVIGRLASIIVSDGDLDDAVGQILAHLTSELELCEAVSFTFTTSQGKSSGRTTDLATEDPATNAPALGEFRATLPIPVRHRDTAIGVLTLYGRRPDAFAGMDEELVASMAEQVAAILTNARLYQSALRQQQQLENAMRNRSTIEQAKGALAATYSVDPGAAFAMLVSQSQNDNVKLSKIAAEIVEDASNGRPIEMRSRRIHRVRKEA